ncbi:MAG: hypothetical protein AB7S71_13275 [Dongiaceae bacterium]
MRMLLRTSAALAAVALLGGCGEAQLYEGEQRPKSNVATLVWSSLDLSSTPADVRQIDGVDVGMWENRAEVLPGSHAITGEVKSASSSLSWPIAFSTTFEAEAGHVYDVVGACQSETSCTGEIRDRGAVAEGEN